MSLYALSAEHLAEGFRMCTVSVKRFKSSSSSSFREHLWGEI